jgi:4-amino-4-deoxy-L-arabinose transferase-like glycosyltransferase
MTTQAAVAAAAALACLLPFAGKAYHIDDPLFLWVARHVTEHPLDFYGFTVNWYGTEMPMAEVTKNPPLASYYAALAAAVFGWGEVALHLAFFAVAAAAAAGSYAVAREFCHYPLVAALAAVFTPVFVLCGASVMCDMMMVACWVWAIALWVRGIKRDDGRLLAFAAVLVAASALSKYFGMSLVPLLFAYGLFERRRPGAWAAFLLVPVAILAGYQWATDELYGRGLLFDAASYATAERLRGGLNVTYKTLTGLAFAGGCLASALFLAPLLWRRGHLAAGALVAATLALAPPLLATSAGGDPRWAFHLQLGLLAAAGLHVLALAVADLLARRDGDAVFLFLWVTGTFVFAAFLNWTISGRTFLPMAPAVGVLVARRLERAGGVAWPRALWALAPAAALALVVAWADYTLANTARAGAAAIREDPANAAGTLWFEGHWGFQYYMQEAGGVPLDVQRSRLEAGDLLVVPLHNTNLLHPGQDVATLVRTYRFEPCRWLSTSHPVVEAGFYSDTAGALPFAFGDVPAEEYYVYAVTRPVQLR